MIEITKKIQPFGFEVGSSPGPEGIRMLLLRIYISYSEFLDIQYNYIQIATLL